MIMKIMIVMFMAIDAISRMDNMIAATPEEPRPCAMFE
jgi:hypothetical protein